MPINSRRKGKTGELELAAFLRAHGYEARRGQQFSGGADSPDIICDLPGLHIECKRTESLRLYPAMAQAIGDAGSKIPVVVHRKSRQDWLAILRLEDLLNLLGPSCSSQEPTAPAAARLPSSPANP